MPRDIGHHHIPLSGGDRKALQKRVARARAMTNVFARAAEEKRSAGEALIREADNLTCQSWNERMWADGGPAQPSPTIAQAINGGLTWLEVTCSRCQKPGSVDLTALKRTGGTPIHQLEGSLHCGHCRREPFAGGVGIVKQLTDRRRYD